MELTEERKQLLISEFKFTATRSSGPGGQNVNKVNTQVELRFNLHSSNLFTDREKQLIQIKLKNRINSEGELVLVSSVERSQLRNKVLVTAKFFGLIEKALTRVKRRIKTSPTKSSKRKRLEGKKLLSKKKQNRRRPEL